MPFVYQVLETPRPRPRRRARMTCRQGHVWQVKSAYLDVHGDNEYWWRRRCSVCGERPMAVVIFRDGQPEQIAFFCWTISIRGLDKKGTVIRLNRQEKLAAKARLWQKLHGGGDNQPVLVRRK